MHIRRVVTGLAVCLWTAIPSLAADRLEGIVLLTPLPPLDGARALRAGYGILRFGRIHRRRPEISLFGLVGIGGRPCRRRCPSLRAGRPARAGGRRDRRIGCAVIRLRDVGHGARADGRVGWRRGGLCVLNRRIGNEAAQLGVLRRGRNDARMREGKRRCRQRQHAGSLSRSALLRSPRHRHHCLSACAQVLPNRKRRWLTQG